jgi:hypothetical protein
LISIKEYSGKESRHCALQLCFNANWEGKKGQDDLSKMLAKLKYSSILKRKGIFYSLHLVGLIEFLLYFR